MILPAPHLYEFGDFRLDASEGVLTSQGRPLPATPKVLHLLKFLIENRGRIVEKEALMRELWAGSFVEDGNLAFTMAQLRKTLGDKAHEPTFVETVPRRGYRFIADVRESTDAETSSKPRSPAKTQRSRLAIVAVVILSLCSLAAASWLLQSTGIRSGRTLPIFATPFRAEKFSTEKIAVTAISPDGKLVAYITETGKQYSVWLRRLETSESVQIIPPSDDAYFGLVFTHDNDSLYFVKRNKDERAPAGIYRVSISGGIPVKVADRAEGWISLSPDDRQISFVRCPYLDQEFCSLYIADIKMQTEQKLVNYSRPTRIGDNQFSPDGRSIAFVAGQSHSGSHEMGLRKIDLSTGVESEITANKFFDIRSFKWVPGNDDLLLTAKENLSGNSKIWYLSASDGTARPLTDDAANYAGISLDARTDKVAATRFNSDFRLNICSAGHTKSLAAATHVSFTPDGKILYSTFEGDVWMADRDGGEPRQLTNDPANDFEPRASADGRTIYFASNRSGSNQIWRMSIDGSDQTQVTKVEGGYPRFVSRDGRWVYYESGLHETLWRVASDGSTEAEVSDRKMSSTTLSDDERSVAYIYRDNRDSQTKIGVMDLASGKETNIITSNNDDLSIVRVAWASDNNSLYYVASGETQNIVFRQSLGNIGPQQIADLGGRQINDFALSPDGSSFAFVSGEWTRDGVLIDGLR